MKIYKYLLSVAIAGAALASCSDALEAPTQSSMDEATIFSKYTLAESAVRGIHQSFGETNSYRGRFSPYYGMNTDCEWQNGGDATKIPDGNKYDLSAYSPTSNNGQMNTSNNAWAKFYEGIERANMIIRGLRTYGNVQNDKDMAHLLGETLTLRAMIYHDLLKAWGDVPARFEPITTETIYVNKADRDSIYKHLLADLAEADTLCYWPNESSITATTERVSRAFVKALRARLALYAGGYSQRPLSLDNRTESSVRLSSDPALSRKNMYTIALNECRAIINKGACKLSASFDEPFKALCQDDVTAGKENIFEIPFSEGRGRELYTWGGLHETTDKYTGQNKGGVNGPIPTLYFDYDPSDVRRDITCVPYSWKNGEQTITGKSRIYTYYFGKMRYEWMKRVVTSTNDDGVNYLVMRYADVLLMAAEAINELEAAPTEEAKGYLRQILARAYPADKVKAIMAEAGASKAAFFEEIVRQRRFEFAGERIRKMDLIRWNRLGSTLKQTKQDMKDFVARTGRYADIPTAIYWKNDGEKIDIVGLDHGLISPERVEELKLNGYTEDKNYLKLDEKYINALYVNDPDTKQFWPIMDEFINTSNNQLWNNYGY
ncbi:MAG: RagB/SusD family nutrient uptake outer membrane protein [Bacteroidaceae bacterium]|nr:RagB/SusD family nutrient uptake outer membrane protein [Bacteroidaceae bacterium]